MKLSRLRERWQRDKKPKVNFLDLPQDVLGHIMAIVPVEDHVACLQTCKYLESIGSRQWVWRSKFCADFDFDPSVVNWKHSYAQRYRYWALQTPQATILSGPEIEPADHRIYDVDFDGQSLIVRALSDGTARVSKLGLSFENEVVVNTSGLIYTCLIDSERGLVYLGSNDGRCLVVCTRTMKLVTHVSVFGNSDEAILRAVKCPFGIIFAGSHGSLSLFVPEDAKGNAAVRLRAAHSAAINGLVYSAKHDFIVTLSCNSHVKVWRWSRAQCRFICCRKYVLHCGNSDLSCLAVYDDSFLVGGLANGSILEFSLIDGRTLGEFTGHQRQVRAMHVDGRYMVTGSYDCSVRLWDLKTRALLQTLEENATKSNWVLSVRLQNRKIIYGAGGDCHLLDFR